MELASTEYSGSMDTKGEEKAVKAAFLPLVYICAPYSGNKELNVKRAVAFAEFAYQEGYIPLTPHQLFPFLDDKILFERRRAMFMDKVLMGKCQEVWVLGNKITSGMREEIETAERRHKKIRYYNEKFEEVSDNA